MVCATGACPVIGAWYVACPTGIWPTCITVYVLWSFKVKAIMMPIISINTEQQIPINPPAIAIPPPMASSMHASSQ